MAGQKGPEPSLWDRFKDGQRAGAGRDLEYQRATKQQIWQALKDAFEEVHRQYRRIEKLKSRINELEEGEAQGPCSSCEGLREALGKSREATSALVREREIHIGLQKTLRENCNVLKEVIIESLRGGEQ